MEKLLIIISFVSVFVNIHLYNENKRMQREMIIQSETCKEEMIKQKEIEYKIKEECGYEALKSLLSQPLPKLKGGKK